MAITQKVIEKFHLLKPKTAKEIKSKLKVKLKPIGNGAFRDVYKIKNTNLVVKVPIEQRHSDWNLRHAVAEFEAVAEINKKKKYERLRKYMPEIHYFDKESGITLMTYYRPFTVSWSVSTILEDLLSSVWAEAKRSSDIDMRGSNIGMDTNGQIVITDLGYFLEKGRDSDAYFY